LELIRINPTLKHFIASSKQQPLRLRLSLIVFIYT